MNSEAARIAALTAAAAAVPRGTSPGNLTSYAEELLPWLTQLPAVRLDVTVSLDGTLVAHSSNGGTMATTAIAGVNTKFDVHAEPRDANEKVTTDAMTFTTDDTAGTILTPSLSADGRTWTGTLTGVLGTVNVTANDTTTTGIPAYTSQLIVQAGPTTHIVGTTTVT